ncbi:MAG: hybrid sensor histidine kinase/response regulator [Deltaproteobacteria bacterium]|nr:MAG: hybrid sensor histidine kinase/response regulator [Deltaproteobacteria bacterium]
MTTAVVPMRPAPTAARPASPERPQPAPSGEPAPRVLLAEDHDAVRRAIARTLRRRGFEVDEAATGQEAIDRATAHCPDLAIVDLRIPLVDGYDVVARLKQTYGPSLPVIVMSGVNEDAARLRAFDAGADDFVAKPVHIPELLKRIDAFERARRAYLEAEAARERAEHLRLYAAEAAALLAHDLNNGLCTALSNLNYLRDAAPIEGEPAEALAAAIRAVKRMAGLVSNFVDIGRIEDGALDPRYAKVDVRTELLDAIAVHQPDATHRGIAIHCACPSDLAAELDPSLFERMLHNLLGNAMRYTPRNGEIGVRARVDADRDVLIVDIGNSGPPIPEHLRGELFEKYRKGGDRRSQVGMGLYFCRLAAEAHGGSICVTDDDRYDTNFHIELPRVPAARG